MISDKTDIGCNFYSQLLTVAGVVTILITEIDGSILGFGH